MRILFIGDIYAKTGREMIKKHLDALKLNNNIDVVIANGENASHGKGLTSTHYQELLSYGVDIITMGNHFFSKNNPNSFYQNANHLVRPANIHPSAAGVGSKVFTINSKKLRVTNLLGRVFIGELNPSSPFEALDTIIKENTEPIHIVDFHAEATAEKIAFAWNYQGQVSAVLGTHTHVQTADERILPKGTAYITDVGMTGPYNSVIGANIEQIIHKTKTGLPVHFDVADGPGVLNAVVIEVNENDGIATSIERISIIPHQDWS